MPGLRSRRRVEQIPRLLKKAFAGWVLALPAALFLLAFLIVPIGSLALTAFWRTQYFQITRDWNLDQFRDVLAQAGVIETLIRSLWTGLIVAATTLIVAFPVAWFLRFRAGTWNAPLLGVVVTVLFSSYLVRIYAWRTLMGRNGAINWTLQTVGLTDGPLLFLFYNRFAVVLTLVHIFLPFVILLLLASLEGVDDDVVEAARVLGARGYQALGMVVLPMISRGVFGAITFTFILAAGDYVTPQLVGGTSGALLGSLISIQFLPNGDYSHGAALSVVFMVALAASTGLLITAARLAFRLTR
jgi:spermidine/putrescine transport system permease protein